MKERTSYSISKKDSININIVKLLMIIGVVLIHSVPSEVHYQQADLAYTLPRYVEFIEFIIKGVIAQSAVPAYFVISGILLFRKRFSWKTNLAKKTRTLIVPYILINSIWVIIYLVVQNVPVLASYFSNPHNLISNWGVKGWIDAYLGFRNGFPIVGPLWFMRDLIVLNILSPVVRWMVEKWCYLYLIVLTILYFVNFDTHLFFLSLPSLYFFSLGAFFAHKRIYLSDIQRLSKPILYCSYLLSVFISTTFRNSFFSYQLLAVSILLGILSLTSIVVNIKHKRIRNELYQLSGYAVAIYLFHQNGLTILSKVTAKLLPVSAWAQVLQFFGNTVLICLISIVIAKVMKKYLPKVYSTLTGNR